MIHGAGASGEVDIFCRPDGTAYVCGENDIVETPEDPMHVQPDPAAIERLKVSLATLQEIWSCRTWRGRALRELCQNIFLLELQAGLDGSNILPGPLMQGAGQDRALPGLSSSGCNAQTHCEVAPRQLSTYYYHINSRLSYFLNQHKMISHCSSQEGGVQ